jgi:hypothetical protein
MSYGLPSVARLLWPAIRVLNRFDYSWVSISKEDANVCRSNVREVLRGKITIRDKKESWRVHVQNDAQGRLGSKRWSP